MHRHQCDKIHRVYNGKSQFQRKAIFSLLKHPKRRESQVSEKKKKKKKNVREVNETHVRRTYIDKGNGKKGKQKKLKDKQRKKVNILNSKF